MTTVDKIETCLAGMRTELWPGISFYLTDPIQREEAAKWLASLMDEMDLI